MHIENLVNVVIAENKSSVSDTKLKFLLEKKNEVPALCKLLIIFENNDIIIIESEEDSKILEDKIINVITY